MRALLISIAFHIDLTEDVSLAPAVQQSFSRCSSTHSLLLLLRHGDIEVDLVLHHFLVLLLEA